VLDAPLSDDVELCIVLAATARSARAAPLRGHERPGLRGQLWRGRLPRHGRSEDDDVELGEAFELALAGDFEVLTLQRSRL